MDISFWIIIWIIFLVVQNVADKKKKSKQPPINSENPPDFEIPTLANDPNFPDEKTSIQSAEVREINLAEIYRQKKIESQNFSEQTEKIHEVEQKNLPLNLNSETAMNAMILSEIFGKPKSLRRR